MAVSDANYLGQLKLGNNSSESGVCDLRQAGACFGEAEDFCLMLILGCVFLPSSIKFDSRAWAMSPTEVTRAAPALMRLLVPMLSGLVALPGTAMTVFPCSKAKLAVEVVPLRSAASTTKSPSARPATMRFLAIKCVL